MAKKLGYQVIEDNGGGLHLAIFNCDDEYGLLKARKINKEE